MKTQSTFYQNRQSKREGVALLVSCGFTVRAALNRLAADMPQLFHGKTACDAKDKQIKQIRALQLA